MYKDFAKLNEKVDDFKNYTWLCTVRETEVYDVDLLYNKDEEMFLLTHVCKDLLRDKVENQFEYYERVSLNTIIELPAYLDCIATKFLIDAEKYLYDNNIQPNCYEELFKKEDEDRLMKCFTRKEI